MSEEQDKRPGFWRRMKTATEKSDRDVMLDDDVSRGVEWRPAGDIMAVYFRELEVKTAHRRALDVLPGEAAVVIHRGRVEEVITQKRLKVGGFVQQLGRFLGWPSKLAVLLVDNTAIQIELLYAEPFEEQLRDTDDLGLREVGERAHWRPPLVTADKVRLPARVTAWVEVGLEDLRQNPSIVAGLLGLMKGKRELRHAEVARLIADRGLGQTLQEVVARHDAHTLRANAAIADELLQQARAAVQDAMKAVGLWLRDLRIVWGIAGEDSVEIAAKARDIQERKEERKATSDIKGIESEARVEEAKVGTEQGLQARRTSFGRAETQLDADTAARVKRVERETELSLKRDEDKLSLEVEAARQALDVDRLRKESDIAREMLEAQKRLKIEARQRELDHKRDLASQQSQLNVALIQAAAQTGSLTPDVVAALTRGQALQGAALLGADEAAAVAGAVGSQRELEAYKQGQREDRGHQSNVLQGMGQVAQGFRSPGMMGFAPLMPQVTAQPEAPQQLKRPVAPISHQLPVTGTAACGHCGTAVQSSWMACPACGTAVAAPGVTCPCGATLQDGWKACPACGRSVGEQGAACPCGASIQPGWKACPCCGSAVSQQSEIKCGCGAAVQKDWKACPACGELVQPESIPCCCGASMQPGWKACPACGTPVGGPPQPRVCSCGAAVQTGWKACPACGTAGS